MAALRTVLADDLPSLLVPMRYTAFASRTVGRKSQGVGWQGWNPDLVMESTMARLNGAGSFYWLGAVRVYSAARHAMLTDPTIHQIKIETISGREVARIYRTAAHGQAQANRRPDRMAA